MEREELLARITEIGTCEDDVQRRTMLTEVSDAISEVYDREVEHNTTIESLNATITKNTEKIQALQEANMDFYLKLNAQKTNGQIQKASTGIEPEANKRKFEDLFKEEEVN